MADLEVRTKIRTLMLDSFALANKSKGASTQLLGVQKKTYACDSFCRDTMNLVTPVLVDDAPTRRPGDSLAQDLVVWSHSAP